MNNQVHIDKPDAVAVSYDEKDGVIKVVVQKREESTDEDLSYTFTAIAGPVNYVIERHDAERLTRM